MGVILVVLMFSYSFLVILLPYIVGIILSAIIIFLIKRKIVIEERKYRKIKNIVIVIWASIFFISGPLWFNYIRARPDDTYIEIKKMNDNKSLIGLSRARIEELLGEKTDKDEDVYCYSAGTITNHITGGHRKFYIFEVYFDENDIVKFTSIREST